MSSFRWQWMVGLAVVLVAALIVCAQQKMPRIGYVYPAGGRQGTTFQVTVGGEYLEGIDGMLISGTGASATVLEHNRPLTVKEASLLQDKLKELQKKREAAFSRRGGTTLPSTRPTWTAEDEKMVVEIRKKLMAFIPRTQINPAISEIVMLQVTLAADAEPGLRELRLKRSGGMMSNPLVFCVDQLPEFSKGLAKVYREPRNGMGPKPPPVESEMSITLPAVVNGQIMPGGVDRFHFKARMGQRLVIVVSARQLIPYLSDAVPGWFQAVVVLYDAKGKELAYDDHYRFSPDPVLYYQIPKEGEYTVEIHDALYRGREDFVYRIALGELPFITSIFPLGAQAGKQTSVTLTGWNLPSTRLTPPARESGIYSLSMRNRARVSNLMPFMVDTFPECVEREPNNQSASAQPVKLPIIVNGRIDQPGDSDVFSFEAEAGKQIVAEVYARRLNSPLDSVLKLTDAAGKQLAYNDDHEDKGSGLSTHHADSRLQATLPARGTYYIHIGDAQQKGGPEYAYRLRISALRPNFELRVVPSSISVRGGMSAPLTVYALRKDGFTGEIALALKDAPEGFALGGAQIPANQDQVRITLAAPPMPQDGPLNLHIEGHAMIQNQQIVRLAVPAEDMMQAFSYRHLVPAQELVVSVLDRFMVKAETKILTPTPIRIPIGGTARIQISVPVNALAGRIQFELSEPPDGITIKSVSNRDGTEIVLQCNATKIKPGLEGNLIINATMQSFFTGANRKGPAQGQGTNQRIQIGALPAIPFKIGR